MKKRLTLDRNPLDSSRITTEYFHGLENSLTTLSLNNVNFNVWSPASIESLMRLKKLQTLKLNGNTQIEETLNVNTLKLELDTVKHSQLNRLPALTTLELQNNNLKQLPSFLCNLKSLVNLDLSSNSLKTIDLDCFETTRNHQKTMRLTQLNLNNNPLQCDCNLRDLKIWMLSTYDKDLLDLIMWECTDFGGRRFVEVGLHEMTCKKSVIFPVITSSTTQTSKSTSKTTTTTSTTKTTTSKNDVISKNTKGPVYLANTESVLDKALFMTTGLIASQQTERVVMNADENNRMDISYYSLVIGISLGKYFLFDFQLV